MKYLVKCDQGLTVIETKGFTPTEVLCELPKGIEKSDYQFLSYNSEFGVYVDAEKKSKWLKEQIKNAKLSE